MKFLGITIYAAALLAYTQALPGNWKGHGKKVEEIHYQVVDSKPIDRKPHVPNKTTKVPTGSGISPLAADVDECVDVADSALGEEISHFTGIFFGDFTTGGTGQDILGPLAVGGNFHAPNYIVNANHDITCSADETSSYDSIGLVVGGDSTTSGTHVRGDTLISGDGDDGQFDQQLEGCRVIVDEDTGHFNFPQSNQDANDLNAALAALAPNSVLNQGGAVTTVPGANDGSVKIFQFDTCDNGPCGSSFPDEIFYGNGNWNGPSGDVPSDSDTVIFNIPVTSGSTITLGSNAPTQGFNSCNTIYNFYAVDENGDYDPDGEFTINRETGSQLEGLVIAPQAHIRDGNTGNFAGTVIGKDYGWLDQSAGVEIHNWEAAGCSNFGGCFPTGNPDPNPNPNPSPSPTDVTPVPTDSGACEAKTVTETVYVVKEEKDEWYHKKKGKGKKGGKGDKKHEWEDYDREDKW
ncbi:hypothetical protein K492DRAFT_185236 [Lichtheimia hyalospora FSU 10163]|nr:hypothetical protein K492DRAFT_185236 [Lichtheimia hyalospora FSU 10163]